MTTQSATTSTPSRSAVIWVIEDSPQDFSVLQRAMSSIEGATALRQFVRAEEALEALGDGAETPDLLIVDLNLPGIDGVECIRRIRASDDPWLRRLPICMLTSSDRESDQTRAREAGADGYRVKPRRAAELRALADYTWSLAGGAG